MAGKVLVRGLVRFEPTAPPFDNAEVRVRLEDVSTVDAPAALVAEQSIPGVAKPPGPATVAFAVHGDGALDPHRHYGVRVHVDVDGSGRVSAGDFVSTEAYPIRADDGAASLDILVRTVR
jgi:putative lipoprotein